MTVDLPRIIADYFAAERDGDPDTVVACFTEEAVVSDERQRHIGATAIRRWKAEASTQYNYTVEPVHASTTCVQTIVSAHVSGDFPGSPVDLRYQFYLKAGKIAELEIAA